jgi:MFS family permease
MTPITSEEPKPPAAGYRWQVVAILWFICFFNYADRQAIFSIFPVLQSEYGSTKGELGQIGAAFTLVYALTAPFAGQFGDRFSRKAIILGGLYVWSAITGLTGVCSKVWHFVLVRGAEGLGETFYFPASMSLISDYHGKATRSRAMSLHQTSVYVGTIGGGALAGWMAQHWGWQTPFGFLAVAGILLGLVLAAFIREPARNAAEAEESAGSAAPSARPGAGLGEEAPVLHASEYSPAEPVPEAIGAAAPIPMGKFLAEWIRTPTAVLLVIGFFGANTVALVFLTWMPTFLKEKFHLDLAQAGLGATIYIQLASLVGASLGGFLADKWRARKPGGRIFVQALGALMGAPFIFFCGHTRDLWSLAGAMTLFGLSKGIYDSNIWASLYDVIPPSRRAAAVGFMNMIGWLGGALGAWGIGAAVDAGFTMSAAIGSTALFYLIVAVLLGVAASVFAPRDVRGAMTTEGAA